MVIWGSALREVRDRDLRRVGLVDKIMTLQEKNRAQIRGLARDVLQDDGMAIAGTLVGQLKSRKASDRNEATTYLKGLFPGKQKRPLSYLRFEIENRQLSDTRPIILYAGMYVEWLVKFLRKDLRNKRVPLGFILNMLGRGIPEELRRKLKIFNRVFWAPAKHTVDGYADDEHLYNVKDAVLCCLITARLAEEITAMSGRASDYAHGRIRV
jgi:hypothetical protein